MRRRFALTFSVFDEERCQQLSDEGANPFFAEQLIIVSDQFVAAGEWQSQLQQAEFDLLVVDEAHHMQAGTAGYEHTETLCQNISDVLLLTATPEQEGSEGHFQRLRLLDPNRFNSLDIFNSNKHYRELAEPTSQLTGEPSISCSTSTVPVVLCSVIAANTLAASRNGICTATPYRNSCRKVVNPGGLRTPG